jgi:hypothetical protein
MALHAYDTLVYEFILQENRLLIVLIEADYTEDNNYTERTIMNRWFSSKCQTKFQDAIFVATFSIQKES